MDRTLAVGADTTPTAVSPPNCALFCHHIFSGSAICLFCPSLQKGLAPLGRQSTSVASQGQAHERSVPRAGSFPVVFSLPRHLLTSPCSLWLVPSLLIPPLLTFLRALIGPLPVRTLWPRCRHSVCNEKSSCTYPIYSRAAPASLNQQRTGDLPPYQRTPGSHRLLDTGG